MPRRVSSNQEHHTYGNDARIIHTTPERSRRQIYFQESQQRESYHRSTYEYRATQTFKIMTIRSRVVRFSRGQALRPLGKTVANQNVNPHPPRLYHRTA